MSIEKSGGGVERLESAGDVVVVILAFLDVGGGMRPALYSTSGKGRHKKGS